MISIRLVRVQIGRGSIFDVNCASPFNESLPIRCGGESMRRSANQQGRARPRSSGEARDRRAIDIVHVDGERSQLRNAALYLFFSTC